MSIYVDPLRDWGWKLGPSCHLIANSNEELHAFALRIGIKRAWFQTGSTPHYDLVKSRRDKAVSLGAIELNSHDFGERCMAWRKAAGDRIKAVATEEEKAAIRAELYR